MNALTPFTFPETGQPVRTVLVDDEPWFVATDVATVLELSNLHSSLAQLDDDERTLHSVESGQRSMSVVSESGLYSLVLRSRKDQAKAFKRWITHDVLPSIRKTGRYETGQQPAFAIPATFAEALELAARQARELESATARVAELAPAAESWETLASANGDYSVADAAKVLSRDGAIQIGRDRLFTTLAKLGWTYRAGDGRWRIKQTAVETGRLSELPSSHYHPRTGELVLDPPQVRVTVKGVADLRRALGAKTLETAT